MPLKPGRFLREMESYSKITSSAILDEVPRSRCCDQKRKKWDKRKNDDDENQVQPPKKRRLMDLYKSSPKTSATPKSSSITPANNVNRTPTSSGIFHPRKLELSVNEVDDFIQIDDLRSQEQWNRKRKSKFSHIKKINLKKINKTDSRTELNKILEIDPMKKKSTGRTLGMKASLIDNPATYLVPEINFVVSGVGKLLLHKDDYKTLQGTTILSIQTVEFVLTIFQSKANKVQFEAHKTSMIFDEVDGAKRMIKFNKNIFIGTLIKDEHFTLVIVNCKKRHFSLIDPKSENPPEVAAYFEKFKRFIVSHNKKYNEKIPEDNWRIQHLQHQLECDEKDSGLFVLNFAKQYIDTAKMDQKIVPEQYRVYLQHLILQKSKRMNKSCVLRGLNLRKFSANTSISHVTCTSCNRGTHLQCLNKVEEDFKDDSLNFFCLICKSNSINPLPEHTPPFADAID